MPLKVCPYNITDLLACIRPFYTCFCNAVSLCTLSAHSILTGAVNLSCATFEAPSHTICQTRYPPAPLSNIRIHCMSARVFDGWSHPQIALWEMFSELQYSCCSVFYISCSSSPLTLSSQSLFPNEWDWRDWAPKRLVFKGMLRVQNNLSSVDSMCNMP